MSKESATQFLEKILESKQVNEILKNTEKPKNKEEKAKLLAKIAAEMNEDISVEEFDEALAEIEEKKRQRTDSIASEMQALDDAELEDVAGGSKSNPILHHYNSIGESVPGCAHDFTDDDCVILDACDSVWEMYYDCEVTYYAGCERNY